MALGLAALAHVAQHLRGDARFASAKPVMGLYNPPAVVVGHRDAAPSGSTYALVRPHTMGSEFIRQVLGVIERLAGLRQGLRGPHKGLLGARGQNRVGIAGRSIASVEGVTRCPKGGPELRPPHARMALALSQVHNTPHTARVYTHSPPILHYPYARHPGYCHLAAAPWAHQITPHHTTPQRAAQRNTPYHSRIYV